MLARPMSDPEAMSVEEKVLLVVAGTVAGTFLFTGKFWLWLLTHVQP